MSDEKVKQNLKFNIFKVARIWKAEEIHTRIIAELINPHSKFHEKGQIFLDMFLKEIKEQTNLNIDEFAGAYVDTEVHTSDGRYIDMVISTDNYYIPFEVKIWAKDQPNQLNSYYKFAQQKGNVPAIFYLTPYGYSPSVESQGDLADSDICCISFKKHILSWLDRCISLDVPQDIFQILKQLRDNIDDGFSLAKNEVDSLLNIIQDRLSDRKIIWTECTSTYLTLRLSKKGLLEFALRISINRKDKLLVKLQIICGVEQMNGLPSYSNTVKYIDNHYSEFIELLGKTFNQTINIKTESNNWARFEKTFELLANNTEDKLVEECYISICKILDICPIQQE